MCGVEKRLSRSAVWVESPRFDRSGGAILPGSGSVMANPEPPLLVFTFQDEDEGSDARQPPRLQAVAAKAPLPGGSGRGLGSSLAGGSGGGVSGMGLVSVPGGMAPGQGKDAPLESSGKSDASKKMSTLQAIFLHRKALLLEVRGVVKL